MAMEKEIASFVSVLLHSGTIAHLQHLQTESFAKHKALGKYYPTIIDLVDNFVESYQGRYGVIKKYPNEYHPEKEPTEYFQGLQEFVDESREFLPKDTELQNIVDEIATLINSTLYKLKHLK